MLHSLESIDFLKVDPENYILFECADEEKVISVEQEFHKGRTDNEEDEAASETKYDNIYSIKLYTITLRELLLFHSLYVCKTQSDIVELVEDQPNPLVFYKAFLEFDGANMTSILSFDSRSMAALLDDKNKEHFDSEFPIFYRNKIAKKGGKFFYRSAIDSALRNN
jgi:hypothetical protein